MWYLTILAFAVAAIGAWFFFKKASPDASLDVNKDNRLDVNDIKFVADVNKDGKVDVADAKAAVVEVVAEVKQAVVEEPKPAQKPKKTAAKKAATPKKAVTPKKTTTKAKK
jgi:hypothetical protein